MYMSFAPQAMQARQHHATHDADQDNVSAEHLNDLLADWHYYCQSYNLVHGFPTVDAACRLYRASRQYDDTNGAFGVAAWVSNMQAVDHLIGEMEAQLRTALAFQARNFHTRAQVWSSPRLPVCAHARAEVLVKARKIILKKLHDENLM